MKLRVALATATLCAAALVGLTACGQVAAAAASMTPEGTALSALGFSPDQVTPASDPSASPTPSASPGAGKAKRHPAPRALTVRRALAKNVEHGEVVVQTRDGDKTIEVQRGTVTAIDATTVTVKSTDGFTQTWTFGKPIHVIEHRTSVQPSNVVVGTAMGVAGAKSGGTTTASLLVIPETK